MHLFFVFFFFFLNIILGLWTELTIQFKKKIFEWQKKKKEEEEHCRQCFNLFFWIFRNNTSEYDLKCIPYMVTNHTTHIPVFSFCLSNALPIKPGNELNCFDKICCTVKPPITRQVRAIKNSNLTIQTRLIRRAYYGNGAITNSKWVQITSFVPLYMEIELSVGRLQHWY